MNSLVKRLQREASDALALGGLTLVALCGGLLVLVLPAAWVTHVIICFQENRWGFLIAGAIFFPIAIAHGIWLWFHWW